MSKRFLDEAIKRKSEVEIEKVKPYMKKILKRLDEKLDEENALMYSTLIQNYTRQNIL